eukprot:COSAG02_NODE_1200_length_13909_cov_15.541202_1_plen_150_part_00
MPAAINQVLQNLLDHLMRVSATYPTTPTPIVTVVHQQRSRPNSWWRPLAAPLPTHPPVAASSTHLATPQAISTPIHSRQCPPTVGNAYNTTLYHPPPTMREIVTTSLRCRAASCSGWRGAWERGLVVVALFCAPLFFAPSDQKQLRRRR